MQRVKPNNEKTDPNKGIIYVLERMPYVYTIYTQTYMYRHAYIYIYISVIVYIWSLSPCLRLPGFCQVQTTMVQDIQTALAASSSLGAGGEEEAEDELKAAGIKSFSSHFLCYFCPGLFYYTILSNFFDFLFPNFSSYCFPYVLLKNLLFFWSVSCAGCDDVWCVMLTHQNVVNIYYMGSTVYAPMHMYIYIYIHTHTYMDIFTYTCTCR